MAVFSRCIYKRCAHRKEGLNEQGKDDLLSGRIIIALKTNLPDKEESNSDLAGCSVLRDLRQRCHLMRKPRNIS